MSTKSNTTKQNITKRDKKIIIFLKILVITIIVHGMLCVTCSYVMAWMGKENVLETLSSTIIGEIVAPLVVYGVSKTVENIFEKNDIFSKDFNDV